MTTVNKDLQIYFTTTKDGTVLAASNQEPYFCFEAETEEEAGRIVLRAVEFYESAPRVRGLPVSDTVNVINFVPGRIRRRGDLTR